MTNEKAIKILSDWDGYFVGHSSDDVNEALDKAIKALEQQSKPIEKFDDVKTHIQRLAGDYKCWDNRLTWEEALELNRMLEAHPTHGSTYGGVSWGGTYKEEAQPTDASPWGTKLGTWIERTVIHKDEAKEAIEEWQSARCSVCGKYHTTPYMYYFDEFKFCPNCGSYMGGGEDG